VNSSASFYWTVEIIQIDKTVTRLIQYPAWNDDFKCTIHASCYLYEDAFCTFISSNTHTIFQCAWEV